MWNIENHYFSKRIAQNSKIMSENWNISTEVLVLLWKNECSGILSLNFEIKYKNSDISHNSKIYYLGMLRDTI